MDLATPETISRPWLAHYPDGVPHDIDPSQYRSLAALLEESLKKNARRPVSVCMERWMSYGELDQHSAALGAWLQSRGLPAGARIAATAARRLAEGGGASALVTLCVGVGQGVALELLAV